MERSKIQDDICRLEPWYQPISIGPGLATVARDKRGNRIRVASTDRGLKKWKRFILPGLPFDLDGKRVLDIGCNAGLFPLHSVRVLGAREAVGIEKNGHYYDQAKWMVETFSHLDGRHLPVRIYRGAMEDFDYESLGRFDIVFMFAVIYHIGKSQDYAHLSQNEIRNLQIKTLCKVAKVTPLIVFQANPLKDEGRGKGIESLKSLVLESGLSIEKETRTDHARGYVLVARSGDFHDRETFPLSRMCNKYFLPARQSAEYEAALRLEQKPDTTSADMIETRYWRLRTGTDDWTAPGQAHLPEGLERPAQYWVMPWSVKKREAVDVSQKTAVFSQTLNRFRNTIESIMEHGLDATHDPIPGYKLVHPDFGVVFIYIDGNRRLGALALRSERLGEDPAVPVQVRQVIRRENVAVLPLARQLIESGDLTEADVMRWFDNAFWFVTGENNS